MRARIAAAFALAALAAAPPALAANADVRAVDDPSGLNNRWDPPEVTVSVGDTVTWRFDGSTFLHNVKSTSGSWNVDTPGTVGGAPFTYTFSAEGTYEFVCKYHANSMKGKVTVGTPPPPPPPPPSEQPWTNDQQPPSDLDVADEKRPRLSGVRAAAVRNGARVRFRLSERARVSVRFKLAGVTVKSARRTFRAGRHRFTVRDRRLNGRYKVEVVARDLAGNRSRVERDRLTIR